MNKKHYFGILTIIFILLLVSYIYHSSKIIEGNTPRSFPARPPFLTGDIVVPIPSAKNRHPLWRTGSRSSREGRVISRRSGGAEGLYLVEILENGRKDWVPGEWLQEPRRIRNRRERGEGGQQWEEEAAEEAAAEEAGAEEALRTEIYRLQYGIIELYNLYVAGRTTIKEQHIKYDISKLAGEENEEFLMDALSYERERHRREGRVVRPASRKGDVDTLRRERDRLQDGISELFLLIAGPPPAKKSDLQEGIEQLFNSILV